MTIETALRHYTTDELKAVVEAERQFGTDEAADIVQGMIDTREADAYAQDQTE